MHLTPREAEKLLLFMAGELAEKRKTRGLNLNYPEAIALISSQLQEAARDGKTVAALMQYGTTVLSRDDVMEGIPEMIDEIQIEATFPEDHPGHRWKGHPHLSYRRCRRGHAPDNIRAAMFPNILPPIPHALILSTPSTNTWIC